MQRKKNSNKLYLVPNNLPAGPLTRVFVVCITTVQIIIIINLLLFVARTAAWINIKEKNCLDLETGVHIVHKYYLLYR